MLVAAPVCVAAAATLQPHILDYMYMMYVYSICIYTQHLTYTFDSVFWLSEKLGLAVWHHLPPMVISVDRLFNKGDHV